MFVEDSSEKYDMMPSSKVNVGGNNKLVVSEVNYDLNDEHSGALEKEINVLEEVGISDASDKTKNL